MSYEKCTFILFIIVAVVTVGVMGGPPQKIIGGTYARLAEFPYQVSLRERGRHTCGGAIIDDQHILTAAHCIIGVPDHHITVVTGTNSISRVGIEHMIKRAVMHPDYKGGNATISWFNDIAIVTLAYPMTFNKKQEPISLASRESYDGMQGVVAGWGRFEKNSNSSSNLLQKLNTKVQEIRDCRRNMPINVILHKTQVCDTGSIGLGTCHGDSGSPLVVNKEVIGVVSFVIGCAKGFPNVYTKVFTYRSWIFQEMRRK